MLNLSSLACVGLFHTRAARRLQIGPSLDSTQTHVSQRYHWKDTVLSIKIELFGSGYNLKLPGWLIYITQTHTGHIHRELHCVGFKKKQAWTACFSFRPDINSRRIYRHFTHKCCRLGGRMTKAETPSYNLKEQQDRSPAEDRGPLKPSPSIASMQ